MPSPLPVPVTPAPVRVATPRTSDLHVTGQIFAGVKDAIVPFPDGSKRVLHCVESPEHWFEDFGSARLKRGRATVTLDAEFAKVVMLNGYRVFLTPEGDCKGLYVHSKRGVSFEVRELQGGTSSIAFSYASSASARTSSVTRALPRSTRPLSRCPSERHGQRAGASPHDCLPQCARCSTHSRKRHARKLPSAVAEVHFATDGAFSEGLLGEAGEIEKGPMPGADQLRPHLSI
jgi:hypothetical protein